MNTFFDRIVERLVVVIAVVLIASAALFMARAVDHQDAAQWAEVAESGR